MDSETQEINAAPEAGEVAAGADLDKALDAIWDRDNVTNGADRADNGQFASTGGDKPAEGGAETESAAHQQQQQATDPAAAAASDVALPSNWYGLDKEWAAIPPEARARIAEHQREQAGKMSEMGRAVASYRPLGDAAQEFAEYFNGTLKLPNGQPITPADGIRYLANIQRAMDNDPLPTLLNIAQTYNLTEQLARHFGGQVQQATGNEQMLLNKISSLEATIRDMGARQVDPAQAVERILDERELGTTISRFAEAHPLYAQVEPDLPFFIQKARAQLPQNAGHSAILEKAYTLAVEADPALRAHVQAADKAAPDESAKAQAAKRATSINVTSTGSGKARPLTEDELLAQTFDQMNRKG